VANSFDQPSGSLLAEAVTFACGTTQMRIVPFLIASAVGNGVNSFVLSANSATLLPETFVGPGLFIPLVLPMFAWLVLRWITCRKNAAQTT
jgi:uncharacterized membrane protein YdjX (TVP38/TMEM64 family)